MGAGPGAVDLLTLRGAKRIAEADLVLYASGTTDPLWLREHTRADAELIDCARLGPDEIAEHYRRLASRRGTAVRVVNGDPALSPRLREQLDLCTRLGLDVEVVPGVSPISAAAGTPLVEAGAVDSLSITVVDTDFTELRALAAPDRTLAVRAPAARTADLVEALRAAGVADTTPAIVADKISRPDETTVHTTVGDLVAEVKKHNLWRTTLFLIGDTLRPTGKPRPTPDDPTPRWTARSWRRPTDEPRKTWSERRAEATAHTPLDAAPRRSAAHAATTDSATTHSATTHSVATPHPAATPHIPDPVTTSTKRRTYATATAYTKSTSRTTANLHTPSAATAPSAPNLPAPSAAGSTAYSETSLPAPSATNSPASSAANSPARSMTISPTSSAANSPASSAANSVARSAADRTARGAATAHTPTGAPTTDTLAQPSLHPSPASTAVPAPTFTSATHTPESDLSTPPQRPTKPTRTQPKRSTRTTAKRTTKKP
ncbi:SAM-dependent methyltransferase [Actinokineospora sp. NPDC004072]